MTKLKRYIIFAFVIASCASGCRKEGVPTYVSGQVTDITNGLPVKNMTVQLLECDGGFYFGSDRCSVADSVLTNADGKYRYAVPRKKGSFYKVRLKGNDQYWTPSYPVRFNNREQDTVNFPVYPVRVLELKTKISRPDKKYLQVLVSGLTGEDYWHDAFYNGENPPEGLDTIFYSTIMAGKSYALLVHMATIVENNRYKDGETFGQRFKVDTEDTTKLNYSNP